MKKTCLLIPGNPVVASYYHTWMREIEKSNDIHMVYATSYVLFDRKLNSIEYDLAMRKHYENLLLGLTGVGKIIILAHSVGGYFALRLLEKYPEKIEKVILIFPYIGYSTIKSLRFIGILYSIDRVLPLSELVARCKILFRGWYKDVHSISNLELTTCLRFGVRQCVYFNKHKFNTQIVSPNKGKIDFIYNENDIWSPVETIELLKPVSNYTKVDLPHDFILTKEGRLGMTSALTNRF